MYRWWTYQRERFPIAAHGPLILAFSSCAVSFSALLGGRSFPGASAYAVAALVCFLIFLQLRLADEFKDAEEDARHRPYRPVPRGLVTLRELGILFAIAAAVQLAATLLHHPPLAWILLVVWTYLALMSVEFFARDWLKARPITYLWTHMLIMPMVDFFATACEWMPRGGAAGAGLIWFLTASFLNGVVIEIGRKLRQPDEEEPGVETYSKLWGHRAAPVFLAVMAATGAAAVAAAAEISFAVPVIAVLSLVWLSAALQARRFMAGQTRSKSMEAMAGIWTLALYLTLGLVPLAIRELRWLR